jgi:hypothetical protein
MKLTLDILQRLNLHALIGAQRGNSVDEVRLWWRLQDRFELSEAERKQINFRVDKVGEAEQPAWDFEKKLLKEFSLSEEEGNKIEALVTEWFKSRGFIVANDRRWLEPLLDQFLPEPVKVNGNALTEAPVPARHRA